MVPTDPTTRTLPPGAFIERSDGSYEATELTRGPWNPQHQHGGPPSALIGRAIARAAAPLGFTHMARLTINLLRPIPIAVLTMVVETVYAGRNAAHFAGQMLMAGKEVARFTALAQRPVEVSLPSQIPGHPLPTAPRSFEESQPVQFPYEAQGFGYPDLMELRVAEGAYFAGPCAVWFRLRRPLVEGQETTSVERVAVAADSGNGISSVLDFKHYLFLNSDLTINLFRQAKGEWICIDARTLLGTGGCALAETRIFDTEGLIGRSTQSLLIRMRE